MRDNQERRKDLRRDAARDRRPLEREDAENILEGRNALTEALASGRAIDKVFIAEGSTDRALARLAAQAKQAGAVVVETDRRKLDQMSATGAHQGVIAMVAAHSYATLDDILNRAKERGVWIFGTAAEGATPLYQADLKGAAAIVIGNEGDGMSRLVAESCDLKVSIPMKGRISSLNASAAAAILLYEAVRQRG